MRSATKSITHDGREVNSYQQEVILIHEHIPVADQPL